MYLGKGSHQGVGLPRAGLPEGKDGAGEAGEDAEPQGWPQAVAQGCHLPAWPWQCRPTGEAQTGAAQRAWGGLEGWGPRGARRDSPIYRQLHQLPHPTAFEHGLLRGSRVKHGAEPEGGIVPGRTHLGAGTAAAQGVLQPPPHPDPLVGRWHLRGWCRRQGCGQPAGHLAASPCRSVAGP